MFHAYRGSTKNRPDYRTIFSYFGNITDVQNFKSRFKRVLTCGDSSCKDCLDDYQKLENKFIFFKDLEESLNRFYANITNSKYGGFNVGMLPNNRYELSSNDFIEHERNNPTVHDSKINFDNDSLCVYNEIYCKENESYGCRFSGGSIALDGIRIHDMGFVDRYKYYRTSYDL